MLTVMDYGRFEGFQCTNYTDIGPAPGDFRYAKVVLCAEYHDSIDVFSLVRIYDQQFSKDWYCG
jgi:hypothetical protein